MPGFLNELREQLRTGQYQPAPVREKLIPKPGKPKRYRRLGIPSLRDRLVQMALKIVLEPIFEAEFSPVSYGFRRGRSTLDALAMIQRQLGFNRAGPSTVAHVIEGDIKACFDTIDHRTLMERVRRRVRDNRVLRLIRAFLKAGVMAEGNVRHPEAGTPQGGIVSPLLANIYLSALDERYQRWTPRTGESPHRASARRRYALKKGRSAFFSVRYADDFVVLVSGSKDDTEKEKLELSEFLRRELHMELSQEKTLITDPKTGFGFLGYRVVVEPAQRTGRLVAKLRIPKETLQRLRNRIKSMTARSTTGKSLDKLLQTINPIIVGWSSYYRYATRAWKDFMQLDRWLWLRVHGWLRKKHPKASHHDIRRMYAKRESRTRWTWGSEAHLLKRFGQTRQRKYPCRGTKISNGWNDELDGASSNPEAISVRLAYAQTGGAR